MTDVALALDVLVPGAAYGGSLTDNTEEAFDALRWEDERKKPSWADVEAVVIPEPEPTAEEKNAARLAALEERLDRVAGTTVTGDAAKIRDAAKS